MRIVCAGCSHGRHSQLVVPEGNTLIHTGDYSRRGDKWDAIDFLKWLESQPHRHKIFVDGNHDGYSEDCPDGMRSLIAEHAPSCHYLNDSGVTLDGVRFWGSPVTTFFLDWWWNRKRGPEIRAHWDLIPDDTQVLVTHGPAYGHLDLVSAEYVENGRDRHQGCADLKTTIETRLSKLKCHAFSHLHSQGNQTEVVDGITYINASVVGEDYRVRGDIQVVDID